MAYNIIDHCIISVYLRHSERKMYSFYTQLKTRWKESTYRSSKSLNDCAGKHPPHGENFDPNKKNWSNIPDFYFRPLVINSIGIRVIWVLWLSQKEVRLGSILTSIWRVDSPQCRRRGALRGRGGLSGVRVARKNCIGPTQSSRGGRSSGDCLHRSLSRSAGLFLNTRKYKKILRNDRDARY